MRCRLTCLRIFSGVLQSNGIFPRLDGHERQAKNPGKKAAIKGRISSTRTTGNEKKKGKQSPYCRSVRGKAAPAVPGAHIPGIKAETESPGEIDLVHEGERRNKKALLAENSICI